MNLKFLSIAATISCFILSGCHGTVDKEDRNILFPEITRNVEKGKLSEIVTIRDALILGDDNDFLIGRISKIEQINKHIFAIQSSGSPIMIFDSENNKFTQIGEIGGGVAEYVTPLDFDVDGNTVYVLTTNGIMRYDLDGKYLDMIKTDLNADGIHVVDDRIMLFVLGDKHVIHLIDLDGKTIAEELPRNSALRISRANSFYEYGDYILFHEGHSNDVFAYDRKSKTFRALNIIPAENAMSIDNESNLIEDGVRLNEQGKMVFDALTAGGQQLCVGVMKDNKPYIYISDNKNSTSISISDIEDDILYDDAISFFTKGTISNEKFITCIYPYVLLENKDRILESTGSPDIIKELAAKVTENDNPVVIEYEFK